MYLFFSISDSAFPISGATKSAYAPEPFDVGRILQADIVSEGKQITLTTTGPIDPGLLLILKLLVVSMKVGSPHPLPWPRFGLVSYPYT